MSVDPHHVERREHRRKGSTAGVVGFVAFIVVTFAAGLFAVRALVTVPWCERVCSERGTALTRITDARNGRDSEAVCSDGKRTPLPTSVELAPVAGGFGGLIAGGVLAGAIASAFSPRRTSAKGSA